MHRRDVGREREEDAGGARARAGRADPHEDRAPRSPSIAWTISRVASSWPPGVSSDSATAANPSARPFARPARTYSAVPPVMAPFTSSDEHARRRGGGGRRLRDAEGGEGQGGEGGGAPERASGHRGYLLVTGFPSSFITSCRSSHAFFFSSGLRRR